MRQPKAMKTVRLKWPATELVMIESVSVQGGHRQWKHSDASSSSTNLLPPPSSSTAVKHEPCLLTLKKGSRLSKPSAWGNFSISPTWRARSTFLWIHRNIFWQLSREENLHGPGMSHAMTASPKQSFRAPRRIGDTMVSRGNAGWTTAKSRHTCLCQNCSQRPPAEKTGRGFLLNHPSCSPDDPISQRSELNCWRQWKSCRKILLKAKILQTVRLTIYRVLDRAFRCFVSGDKMITDDNSYVRLFSCEVSVNGLPVICVLVWLVQHWIPKVWYCEQWGDIREYPFLLLVKYWKSRDGYCEQWDDGLFLLV